MGIKIDALTPAGSLNGTDEFPINVAGVTKKGTINQLAAFASSNIYGTFAGRPAAAASGRIHTPSDGFCQAVDTGAAWKNLFQGVPCSAPPAAATLTVLNNPASAFSVADDKGTLLLKQGPTGSTTANLGAARLSAYPGTPFHLRIAYAFNMIPSNDNAWGVFMRDSATGRAMFFGKFLTASAVKVLQQNFTTLSSLSSTPIADGFPGYSNLERLFFHFSEPGGAGTIKYGWSADGDKNTVVWAETGISRTAWTATPDQFGVGVYACNTLAAGRGDSNLRIFGWDLL